MILDKKIQNLINGPINWFGNSDIPNTLIKNTVSSSIQGVYCLWWKNISQLPSEKAINMSAGSRGKINVIMKPYLSGLTDSIALYIGKGTVRTRLLSHIKRSDSKEDKYTRNPYEWLIAYFPEANIDDIICLNMGFSYIEETNKLEQIYTENLAIGILKPIFNFRLTA